MPDLFRREYEAACAMIDACRANPMVAQVAIAEFEKICDEESRKRKCRLCGCTDESPCRMANLGLDSDLHWDEGGPEIMCAWVEDDLCSFCASTMYRDHEIKTSRGAAVPAGLPPMLAAGGLR